MSEYKLYKDLPEALKDRVQMELNNPGSTMDKNRSIALPNNIYTKFNQSEHLTHRDYVIRIYQREVNNIINKILDGKEVAGLELKDMQCLLTLADAKTISLTDQTIRKNVEALYKSQANTPAELVEFVESLNTLTPIAEQTLNLKEQEQAKENNLFYQLLNHVTSKHEKTINTMSDMTEGLEPVTMNELDDNVVEVVENDNEIADENQLPEDENPENDGMDDDMDNDNVMVMEKTKND